MGSLPLVLSVPGAHGQQHWEDSYPDCGRKAQSPINIQMESAQYDPSLPPVELEGYHGPGSENLTLENNGHTVQMSLPQRMRLHGLPRVYSAVQLHLHWGSQRHTGGSEHLVDDRAFPAEPQNWDGSSLAGTFRLATRELRLQPITLDNLEDVEHADQEISLLPFNIRDLLPAHLGHYFRYNGSLTTPPCYQSVLWTVFHQAVPISATQARPSGYSAGKIVAIIFGVVLGCLTLFLAGWIMAKRIREKTMQDQKGVVFKSSLPRPATD
uniref:Uncharacterized protein n=1 Tax=Sphaerodactylus townsendi TaxID=933632 RepID=A0ACB8G6Y8_9SAUR